MTMNVYTLKDVISNQTLLLGMAPTDGAFIRDTVAQICSKYRLHEYQVYKVGTFDTDTLMLSPLSASAVSMDSYKYPETPVQPMKPEDVVKLGNFIVNAVSKKE